MLFCNRRSVPNVGLFVDGDILIRVSVTKYLGLWLDDKLNWKHYAKHIKKLVKLRGAFLSFKNG